MKLVQRHIDRLPGWANAEDLTAMCAGDASPDACMASRTDNLVNVYLHIGEGG